MIYIDSDRIFVSDRYEIYVTTRVVVDETWTIEHYYRVFEWGATGWRSRIFDPVGLTTAFSGHDALARIEFEDKREAAEIARHYHQVAKVVGKQIVPNIIKAYELL